MKKYGFMAIVTYILMIVEAVIGLGLILIFLKKLRKIVKKDELEDEK